MKYGVSSILCLLLLLGSASAWSEEAENSEASAPAQKTAEPAHSSRKTRSQQAAAEARPNVLNFDADVIEGDKSNPDLFIQLGNQQPSLESVVYGRKNFNEFQRHEAPWRPVYRETTQPAAKPKTAKPARSKQ